MGDFDKIGEAQFNDGGVYVLPGIYRIKVNKVKKFTTRKGDKAFAVDMIIDESNNPDRMVGSTMSWMVMLKHDSAQGNIKHFCSAAWGKPEKDITSLYPDYAAGWGILKNPAPDPSAGEYAEVNRDKFGEQPLEGLMMRLIATNVKTRAEKDFTKVKFMPDSVGAEGAAKEASVQAMP